MPIYEYRCVNGHGFEALQRMADDALSSCEVCGAPAERVLSQVAVHFKGSGFYTTDYGPKKAAEGSGDGKGSSDSGSDSKPAKSDSSSNGAKSDSSSSESSKSSSSSSSD
jgi:putative FmdB family regulatory protein